MANEKTWSVEWSDAAEADLKRMPSWKLAQRVAVAVHRYAETGVGDMRPARDSPRFFHLHAPPYFARLTFDRAARSFLVWRVFRT